MKKILLIALLLAISQCKSQKSSDMSEIKASCFANRDSLNWPLILMYHDLVPTKVDATARDDLAVAWFAQELDLLEKQKWRTISMDELYEIKTNPSKKMSTLNVLFLLVLTTGMKAVIF